MTPPKRMSWVGPTLTVCLVLHAAVYVLRPNWEVQVLGTTRCFRDFLWQPPAEFPGGTVCWREAILTSGFYLLLAYGAWRTDCRDRRRHRHNTRQATIRPGDARA